MKDEKTEAGHFHPETDARLLSAISGVSEDVVGTVYRIAYERGWNHAVTQAQCSCGCPAPEYRIVDAE